MVEAAAIKAATKAGYSPPAHRHRHGSAEDRHVGRCRARHAGKKHAEYRDDLTEPSTDMTDQRLREIGDRITMLADVINSPTRRKNGTANSASKLTPSNIFWMSAAGVTSVKIIPMRTPAISENATGTPR